MPRGHGFRILILLVLLVQGVCDTLPSVASLLRPPATPARPMAARPLRPADSCLCQRCSSGKTCCCHPVQNPMEAAALTAACDTPLDTLVVSGQAVRALPSIAPSLRLFFSMQIWSSSNSFAFSSQQPEPLDQPPRSP
ncbi:MAG TPA: hypothetical protein VFB21_05520 [Chthonomonadaceae bacterium]|nr:hypothetical protein [Chthonomonadaceae bacterium]